MIEPVRVQRRRTKGFNLQNTSPNGLPVVYVGRPTKYGNPFKVEREEQREAAIRMYEQHLKNELIKDPHFLDPLKGKNLACFCPLNKSCHVDVLLPFLKARKLEDLVKA
jgi:hypothetical protein